jgi:hypothetical protein
MYHSCGTCVDVIGAAARVYGAQRTPDAGTASFFF